MALRRDRVAAESGDNSVAFRLGDGRTISVPLKATPESVASKICCFCGEVVEQGDGREISLAAVWTDDKGEQRQTWGAHHGCFAERMHEDSRGTGPFFGDQ
jgi:hypothetical protein